jgi:glycosyltransferase involved in cell wall biosynthesis
MNENREFIKKNVLIFTSVHLMHDSRIVKQVNSLQQAGYECTLVAPWAGQERNYSFSESYFKRKRGIGGRLFAQLIFFKTALLRKWDYIHFHDFDTVPVAIIIRLLTWKRIIYDVHENYGEEVLTREYIPKFLRYPLSLIVNLTELLAARIIGCVVVVVPVQVKRFKNWGCHRVTMVRNYASLEMAPENPVDSEHIHHNGYVINTSGQTLNYGAMLLLDAAVALSKSGNTVPICCIDRFEGSPGLRDLLFRRISDEGIKNYQFLPRVEPNKVGTYLSSSAIGLSIFLDSENKRQAIPTKLFEYMAYGIPIIATDVGYQAEIIRKSKSGIVVQSDCPEALAEAILLLWKDPALRKQLGLAGRKAFFTDFCWEAEVKSLVTLYSEC